MDANPNILRTEIERVCRCSIAWTVPACFSRAGMHFLPLAVAEFLASSVPGLSVGAANQHIWAMAFAETRETMAVALRNLSGLLPADFGGGIDYTEEAAD